jgi:hypothetical protein
VKNLDVRLMTTLAALVGAVALMHDGMGRLMRGGFRVGGGGSRGGGGGKKGGAATYVRRALSPIWRRLSQFSRWRESQAEYLADAMGAVHL